jgi:hypothetical protein
MDVYDKKSPYQMLTVPSNLSPAWICNVVVLYQETDNTLETLSESSLERQGRHRR